MGLRILLIGWLFVTAACSTPPASQTAQTVTVFEGARLIVGDLSPPIEDSAFLVEGDRFGQVGRRGEIQVPAGAVSVDLTGKTIMPALVDELVALFKERPQASILLAQVGRRTIYSPYLDPPEPLLLETVTPAQINRLRDRVAGTAPEALERARQSWEHTARNIMKLHAAGVRIGIGSDGGGQGGDRFSPRTRSWRTWWRRG